MEPNRLRLLLGLAWGAQKERKAKALFQKCEFVLHSNERNACVSPPVSRVLVRCIITSLREKEAGGHRISLGLRPTKLPVKWDIQLGQLDVPAAHV